VYAVPAGMNVGSIFNASLLIGGLVEDQIRTAASSYGPFEFWPGPIPADGSSPSRCSRFNRIYGVQIAGRSNPYSLGHLEGDILDWPVDSGAPFVEKNGIPGYQPADGDHPELLGDQMLWWVMNDRGNEHTRTDTDPLGAEVRGSAFAFRDVGSIGEYTFVRYRITNRRAEPILGMYVGTYTDWDLGAAFDDYIGSDSLLGLGYAYNGDNYDEGNYLENPPAVGLTVLRRPESTINPSSQECRYEDGKSQGLTNHMFFWGGAGIQGDAQTGADVYNYLQSRLRNGEHLKIGGFGSLRHGALGEEANYYYPGDPVTGEYWSELNLDGNGEAQQPSDRRTYGSVGPLCLGPGDEAEVVFAYVWARGNSNLDSVRLLRRDTANLHRSADVLLEPRRIDPAPERPASSIDSYAASIYPNPAPEEATFRLGLPRDTDVQIEVYDIRGRRVEQVVDGRLTAGLRTWTIYTADWPPGVYLVRIQLDHLTETRRLVVVR